MHENANALYEVHSLYSVRLLFISESQRRVLECFCRPTWWSSRVSVCVINVPDSQHTVYNDGGVRHSLALCYCLMEYAVVAATVTEKSAT